MTLAIGMYIPLTNRPVRILHLLVNALSAYTLTGSYCIDSFSAYKNGVYAPFCLLGSRVGVFFSLPLASADSPRILMFHPISRNGSR